ncbi:class I SAM-dependent methyltransferase [Methylobacterium trifolii]|uniref:2-methoxy-6-polyprenyl-1,4-benzoquinol methylase, mitochondrial n=1 Tax=Methylobacterium trifolii TaxID=1003092 RepID=A0ABQ4U619_9HYPH|nr:class I SAM-dependent methyltransferase [Methylobacterium trifolii]GJE61280.1 2-methoxy-6-polyprenyl-1,4-benzoquinol methylase, mitochondrial [Methylobacterium trifolii]
MQNWSVKDDIREYWTKRAETYDLSPGHGVAKLAEMEAWKHVITDHLGYGQERKALDLACGTGVMTMIMHDLRFDVTGLDFTDAMMSRAKRKAEVAQARIHFLARDAEDTYEPDESYDVIIARHLVWTLVDPGKAFAEWNRILKPGGRLLVIDGDFVSKHWLERLMPLLDRIFGNRTDGHSLLTPEQWQAHHRILERIHFKQGVRCTDVMELLAASGFGLIRNDVGLSAIRGSRQHSSLSRNWITSHFNHRFAVSGEKRSGLV